MKRFGLVIKQNIVWLGLLLLTDVAFCFFMWLVAPEAFVRIRVLVGMFTVILVRGGVLGAVYKGQEED